MISASAKCPRCGGDLMASAPDGQCVACLLELGLDGPAPARVHAPASEIAGEDFGPYRAVRILGEGQSSVVYLAEQDEPIRRRLALKIIKPGMHPEAVIARFEAERQALATTDHPNIVKVFDAGSTATSRPYFLTELVAGGDMAHYCDARRLPVPSRLALFVQVCQAVQHIHQKGVVHCNIKSSNILVTEDGNNPLPKIINLGMAEASTTEAIPANPGAPEMDTRADIHALGVLLYELLTGRVPSETAVLPPSVLLATLPAPELNSVASLRQTNRGGLLRLTRGELDSIVMKALKKDLNQCYNSASSLMDDVQRFLNNELVSAHPPSIVYSLEKRVQRHKSWIGIVIAAALAVLFSLAGMLISFRHYLAGPEAPREVLDGRMAAEARRQKQIQVHAVLKAKCGVTQQFDAARDFSATNSNPSGAWAYGSSPDWVFLDGNFPIHTHGEWYDQWAESSADSETSLVRHNFSSAPHEGCPPGGLILRPGGHEYVHLVWTAPEDGLYWVSSRFDLLSEGTVDAFVADRLGASSRMASTTMTKDAAVLLFDSNLYFEKGEQVDFGVGAPSRSGSGPASAGLSVAIEQYGGSNSLPPKK